MFRTWWFGWAAPESVFEAGSGPAVPWWTALLFALACIAFGAGLVIWPALLSVLVASLFIAAGVLILPAAIMAGWETWKRRPRRIRVRVGRAHR